MPGLLHDHYKQFPFRFCLQQLRNRLLNFIFNISQAQPFVQLTIFPIPLVIFYIFVLNLFYYPKNLDKKLRCANTPEFLSLHRIHFYISIMASIFRSSLQSKSHHQEYSKKSVRMTDHFLYTENSDRSCHSDQTHSHR